MVAQECDAKDMTKETSHRAPQVILNPPGLNLSVLCHCSCNGETPLVQTRDECAFSPGEALGENVVEYGVGAPAPKSVSQPHSATPPVGERCIVSYTAALNLPLSGPPLREAEVLHVLPEKETRFEKVKLRLHVNGFMIEPLEGLGQVISLAFSPFSLVQACRLHNHAADEKMTWLRLFKVSVFHHGATHFFATRGEMADAERARWVADFARGVRVLTQSLYPPFELSTVPLMGAKWTVTRLLAGYMILCHHQDVFLAFCELHAHKNLQAAFVAYKDACCDARIVHCNISVNTSISERVGVDCSCFSIDGHHFTTRSSAEKNLWLRAISNVKTKMRHNACNPSELELAQYRAAINESISAVQSPSDCITRCALLPCRPNRPDTKASSDECGPKGPTSVANPCEPSNMSNAMDQQMAPRQPPDAVDPTSLARVTDHISKVVGFPGKEFDDDADCDSCIVSLGPAEVLPRAQVCQASHVHAQLERSPSLLSAELAGPTYKPPQLPEFIERADALSDSTCSEVCAQEDLDDENPGPMALATAAVLHKSQADSNPEHFPPVASEHLPAVCFM